MHVTVEPADLAAAAVELAAAAAMLDEARRALARTTTASLPGLGQAGAASAATAWRAADAALCGIGESVDLLSAAMRTLARTYPAIDDTAVAAAAADDTAAGTQTADTAAAGTNAAASHP